MESDKSRVEYRSNQGRIEDGSNKSRIQYLSNRITVESNIDRIESSRIEYKVYSYSKYRVESGSNLESRISVPKRVRNAFNDMFVIVVNGNKRWFSWCPWPEFQRGWMVVAEAIHMKDGVDLHSGG